jgi:hypothetical protein
VEYRLLASGVVEYRLLARGGVEYRLLALRSYMLLN